MIHVTAGTAEVATYPMCLCFCCSSCPISSWVPPSSVLVWSLASVAVAAAPHHLCSHRG